MVCNPSDNDGEWMIQRSAIAKEVKNAFGSRQIICYMLICFIVSIQPLLASRLKTSTSIDVVGKQVPKGSETIYAVND